MPNMLKNNWITILLIGMCFYLTSCTRKVLNEKELYTYLKDESNGLTHKWKEDPFEISVMYKPSSLLAKQELRDEIDPIKIKTVTDRYNDYLYFIRLVYSEMNVDPESCSLELSGKVDSDSPIYKLLHGYIRNVDLMHSSVLDVKDLRYKGKQHYYLDLFATSICV